MEITQAKLESICHVVNNDLLQIYKLKYSSLNTHNCYYEFKDGSKKNNVDIIQTFLNEKVLNGNLGEDIEEKINFPDGTHLKLDTAGYAFPVLGLTLRGFLIKYTNLDIDWLEDKIWLVMKVIFAETKFNVTLKGEVEEYKANNIQMTVNEKAYFTLKPIIREYIIKE